MLDNLGSLINKYLKHRGVKDATELTDDEQAAYQQWQEVAEQGITVENLTDFIFSQITNLDKELREQVKDGKDRASLYTAARLENYEILHAMLTTPSKNKKALAEYIKELLDKSK